MTLIKVTNFSGFTKSHYLEINNSFDKTNRFFQVYKVTFFLDLSHDVRLMFERERYQVDLHEVHGQTEKWKNRFYSR